MSLSKFPLLPVPIAHVILSANTITLYLYVAVKRSWEPYPSGYDPRLVTSITRQDYEIFWSLSHTNHQIREEIGAVFWKNVYVDLDHWNYALPCFLDDRPAVCGGIKGLRIEWHFDNGPEDPNLIIIDFCEYIATHLVIDELFFVLCTTPSITRQMIAGGEQLAWVKAFRKIVVKNLRVKMLLVEDFSDYEFSNGEEEDDREESGARVGS